MRRYLFLLSVCLTACEAEEPVPAPVEKTPAPTIKLAASLVTLETVPRQDMRLTKVRKGENGAIASGHGISGSGFATHSGVEAKPIHLLSVVSRHPPGTMRLHLHLAATKEWINRSSVMWSGDFVPGVQFGCRMYDGDVGERGEIGRKAAVLHLRLPGRADFQIAFFSFDATGKLIPYFGKRPFADYLRRISGPKKR